MPIKKTSPKVKPVTNKGKILISFVNADGYEVKRYISKLELAMISRIINVTIE